MSDTAFALVDNSFQDYGTGSAGRLLREGRAERIKVFLKQPRDMVATTPEIMESSIESRPAQTAAVYDVGSIIHLPDLNQVSQVPPRATFYALQEWEGYVLEASEDEFTARLLDLTAGSLQEEEEAVIPLAEISGNDLKRLRPGSIFRWVIGYERSASGTKRRISEIVFRDLPAMTKQDMSEGKEWARNIAQSITD